MEQEIRFYKGLAKQYPNVASAATEIINLQAILNLPKGTEHFITDVHGEYLQFRHILRNASGAIRRKIDDVFGPTLRMEEKKGTGSAYLLSAGKVRAGGGQGKGHRGMVSGDHPPYDPALPECGIQVHAFQGTKSNADGFCLCDRGVDERQTG